LLSASEFPRRVPCPRRELKEEIGLDSPIEFLVKMPASPETANEHTILFRVVTDAVPTPDEHEVANLTCLSLEELKALLQVNPDAFSPPIGTLLT
jgi:8-oxo-dGTP pyrophosphatase MutT (NUDIX family)